MAEQPKMSPEKRKQSMGEVTCPRCGATIVLNNISQHLTPREKLILRHLMEGDTNKTIARKNNINEGTVKVYIKSVLRKLKVQNRTQAALWAVSHKEEIAALNPQIQKGE